jgi:hypothetical protein
VLKAAGRAPTAPIRSRRSPFTTRHTRANHSRSLAKAGEDGASVCCVVSEYLIPYWRRLLQADIFPQKLSRRSRIDMDPAVSGVAWINTGTSRPAKRSASAIPRSSPKFGSVTRMPSISSRWRLKSSAHVWDSSRVSTAPCFESAGVSATTLTPARSSTPIISSRPLCARWSGKNPRLPTISPSVTLWFCMFTPAKPAATDCYYSISATRVICCLLPTAYCEPTR